MNKMRNIIFAAALSLAAVPVAVFAPIDAGNTARADEENINVTVPARINVIFTENGIDIADPFTVNNLSDTSVSIVAVNVVEKNGWKLVPPDSEITVDKKEITVSVDGHILTAGENPVRIEIPGGTEKIVDIGIRRGAFTAQDAPKAAFSLEWRYGTERTEVWQ